MAPLPLRVYAWNYYFLWPVAEFGGKPSPSGARIDAAN
jgi:hypothetical protein